MQKNQSKVKFNTKFQKKELILISMCFVGVIFIIAYLKKQFVEKDYKTVQSTLKKQKQELQTNKQLIQKLQSSVQTEELKEKNRKPSKANSINFKQNLATILARLNAMKNDFDFRSIELVEDKAAKETTVKIVRLNIESSFTSIGEFVKKIEDSDLPVEVKNLSFSKMENDMKKCSVNIELFTYPGSELL